MTLQKIIDASEFVIPSTRPKNPRLARLQSAKMDRYYSNRHTYQSSRPSPAEIAQQEADAAMEDFYKIK